MSTKSFTLSVLLDISAVAFARVYEPCKNRLKRATVHDDETSETAEI